MNRTMSDTLAEHSLRNMSDRSDAVPQNTVQHIHDTAHRRTREHDSADIGLQYCYYG